MDQVYSSSYTCLKEVKHAMLLVREKVKITCVLKLLAAFDFHH